MTELDYRQVHDAYMEAAQEHIELSTGSTRCSLDVILHILGLAAVNQTSVNDICTQSEETPTSTGLLSQLRRGWLAEASLEEVEAVLNQLVTARLPDRVVHGTHTVAVDLVEIPYHGQAHTDEAEIRRSKAKSGTTHFHVYGTAYVLTKGKRVTLAVTYCQAGEDMFTILTRLLDRVCQLDVTLNRLLLDRQFCSVKVLSYLQAQPWQSIMPVPARGHALKELKQNARRSHQRSYTMRSRDHGEVTFTLHVVCRYANGRRGHHGMERLLFAVVGRPWTGSSGYLVMIYRCRFGIEAGYRMMNQVRIRTTSRDPKLRLLFTSLALFLLNLWTYLHWTYLSIPRRGGRLMVPGIFRLNHFRVMLRHAIRRIFAPVLTIQRPTLDGFLKY